MHWLFLCPLAWLCRFQIVIVARAVEIVIAMVFPIVSTAIVTVMAFRIAMTGVPTILIGASSMWAGWQRTVRWRTDASLYSA